VLGLFAFGDSLKPGAAQAIDALHAQHISSHLLTGDNRGSAKVVADALGIDDVHAEVLPADKAATVPRSSRMAWWPWSATASTTPRRWPPPTSASPWAAAPTWPCRPPASP
jgi:Cu+-exporting ATPase